MHSLPTGVSHSTLKFAQHVVSARNKAEALQHKIKELSQKSSHIALQVFHLGTNIMRFPVRYFGAKDWSIPGVATNLINAIYNKCVNGKEIDKDKIFAGNKGYHRWEGQEILPEEVPAYFKHLFAYRAVDNNCTEDFMAPLGYKLEVSDELMQQFSAIKGADFVMRDGFIIDLKTQVKVGIFRKNNEVVVAFGSLGAVASKGNKRRGDALKRAFAGGLGAFGLVPKAYSNADKLVEVLLRNEGKRGNSKSNIELAGLSFGGSLAAYVGLRHELKAVCINSYTLGAGLQHKLGKAARARADELVTQIIVKGDFFLADQHPIMKFIDSGLSRIGLRTPGNFGKKYYVRNAFDGCLPAHRYPYACIMDYLGLDKNKSPLDLGDDIQNLIS